MKKKETPLVIIQQMNHFRTNFPGVSKVVKSKEYLIRYEDIDEESDFFFQINSFTKNSNGDFIYSITFKPHNENILSERTRNLTFAQVDASLAIWGNIVKLFNETEFFIDDPITTFYTQEFYNEYKILDDDADVNPFEIKRQLLIGAYLDSSIRFLEEYEQVNTDVDLSESKLIAVELKSELTELSKNQVMLKLSKFWAVTRKKGLPIIKEVFFELAKELLKEFGKKMLGL